MSVRQHFWFTLYITVQYIILSMEVLLANLQAHREAQVGSCVLRPGCSVSPAVNPGVCPVVFLSANITWKAPGSFLLLPLSWTAPSPVLPVPLVCLHTSLHLSKHKSHCVAETFCDPFIEKGNPSRFQFSPVLTAFLSFISYCFLHSACLFTSVMWEISSMQW